MNDLFTAYCLQFVGLPYIWGGNSLVVGADCSGFALEMLRAFGIHHPDMTAHDLFMWCKGQKFPQTRDKRALLFFGRDGAVTHVAIALSPDIMIEAGGGGSATRSKDEAASHNAMVRLRPITARKDLLAVYLPKYPV